MDMQKKLSAILLVVVLLVSLCACGAEKQETTESTADLPAEEVQDAPVEAVPEEPEMTAEILLEHVNAAAETDATAYLMDLKMDASIGTGGITVALELSVNSENMQSADTADAYAKTTTGMTIGEETTTETMLVYTKEEAEGTLVYSNEEGTDSWTVTPAPEEDTATDSDFPLVKDGINATLEEATQTVDGREAYVLRAELTGEDIPLDSLPDSGTEELSTLAVPAVFYFDAETYLPLRIEMDLAEMGELLVASLGLAEEGAEMEAAFEELSLVMHGIRYEPVEIPAVPGKGVLIANQQNANPDQGDGTYVIQESGAAVRITCPEGWTAGEMGCDNVTLNSADGTQSVLYTMYTYIDSMGFYVTVERYRAIPLMDENNYAAHGHGPMIGDYETAWVQSNDGAYQYYAWRTVGDKAILVEMEDLGGRAIEDALTPALEIVADYDLLTAQ